MKKILKTLLLICLFIVILVLFLNFYVIFSTKKNIVEDINEEYDAILILGCGVNNDKPSPMLKDRLDTGISLYKNKHIKIIMSGDHGRKNYDEVNVMKEYAINNGVSSSDIYMDHAGFSTYDSVYRAKDIFGVKKSIIVTQEYHLPRALFLASSLDIKAIGISATKKKYVGDGMREIREIMARDKDALKCIFKPKPTYLGDTILVSGDGNITNDSYLFSLTKDELINISKKESITWDDFKIYKYEDMGNDIYSYKYNIEDEFTLTISGKSLDVIPDKMILSNNNGKEIDIRKENVEKFIN